MISGNAAVRMFRLVKFEHSIFALPFAVASLLLASSGNPPLAPTLLIIAACVFARTSAMSFNRFADAELDAANPRTASREIPSGLLSRNFALALSAVSAGLFIGTCAFLNETVLILSPVAFAVIIGYSYTKRWTAMSHIVLGSALAMAPLGAWLALGREFTAVPALLALAVIFWTAGFDIIYSCQDVDFDRKNKLKSVPASVGVKKALIISKASHALAILLLIALYFAAAEFGWIYLVTLFAVGVLLIWEHSLVSPADLSRVNTAFFTVNGLISMLFMAGVIADVLEGSGA
jgi:4-hydroxybenzoate polyprenyltransferase